MLLSINVDGSQYNLLSIVSDLIVLLSIFTDIVSFNINDLLSILTIIYSFNINDLLSIFTDKLLLMLGIIVSLSIFKSKYL